MEWREPDWCCYVAGPFHAEIYPTADNGDGYTLTLLISGEGGPEQFKPLAERLQNALDGVPDQARVEGRAETLADVMAKAVRLRGALGVARESLRVVQEIAAARASDECDWDLVNDEIASTITVLTAGLGTDKGETE